MNRSLINMFSLVILILRAMHGLLSKGREDVYQHLSVKEKDE
jgi:hypothetical protein